MVTQLRVPDASCGHCKATIEGAVSSLDGVETVDLDLESKLLRVTHDGTVHHDVLTHTVTEAGYEPELVT